MPYFPPCIIDGVAVDLSHLEPMMISLKVEKLNGRMLTIDVRFSNHVYTTAFDPEVHDATHIVMDHKIQRAFDSERHGLSRRLPEMVRLLPASSVWLTASDRNFAFMAKAVDEAGRSYPMFFHLRRSQEVAPRNLALVVESAYPVDDPQRVLAGATKIAFPILCAKVWKGEPIRSRTRR